jgi:hypothetical protein
MAPALVLSYRGCGTTTFLGLFYAALVRWGSSAHDAFRVHASHDSIKGIKDVYASLVDGYFPSSAPTHRGDDLSFVLGYAPGSGWVRAHRSQGRSLSVHVADVEELSELKGRSFATDGWLRARLSSHVALVLLDASRLPPDPAAILALPNHAFRRYDAEVASCLGLLSAYLRTEGARSRALLQPIFVLTKWDLLPSGLLKRGDLGPPPSASDPRRRARWVEALLAERMPQTFGILSGDEPGIRYAPATGFLSSVTTERDAQGALRVRRRLRLPEGGYEPDYPYEEFSALITLLQQFSGPAEELLAA